MKKVLLSGLGLLAFVAPSLVFAQTTVPTGTVSTTQLGTAIGQVTVVINNYLIPLFLTIAGLVFIYGVIKYVISKSAEEKAGARSYIIYGIIGIAVILAIWGLANILLNFFGVSTGGLSPTEEPIVPSQSGAS